MLNNEKFSKKYYFNKYKRNWLKNYEMKLMYVYSICSYKLIPLIFDLPYNRKTNNKKYKHNKAFYVLFLNYLNDLKRTHKYKYSISYLKFETLNRIWFNIWNKEFFKLRHLRMYNTKIHKKRRLVNMNLLKFNHIVRNTKIVNKKKKR